MKFNIGDIVRFNEFINNGKWIGTYGVIIKENNKFAQNKNIVITFY